MDRGRPIGVIVVAIVMIVSGLFSLAMLRILTDMETSAFCGGCTSHATSSLFTPLAIGVSAFRSLCGLSILTMKKWAAVLAFLGLVASVFENVVHLQAPYPIQFLPDELTGCAIWSITAIYIATQWRRFT